MNTIIDKSSISRFFDKLKDNFRIYGPIDKGKVVSFGQVADFSSLVFDRQSDYPPKKYFIPQKEDMFVSEKNSYTFRLDREKRIVIMRPCDANGILCLDKVFLDENPDPYYMKRRENTMIFVFKCTTPCKNGFCTSLRTDDTTNYDLMFIDIGDKYVVNIGNAKAEELTKNKLFSPVIREGSVKVKCRRNLVDVEKLEAHFNSKVWEKEAERCLSCNGCNIVCPTCYCFNVIDVPSLDLKSAKRLRFWSYCHMKDHTKVAGGFVFREDRAARFKHRIYHKLKYFREQTGRHLCVGCGRCIDVCPAKIDMVDIINNLK